MMHPPLRFSPDLFRFFDAQALASELLAKARTEPDGKAVRTLFKSPELTVVVMALRAGAHLLEHSAPGPLLVIPMQGRVSFSSPSQFTDADVGGRTVLAMGPGMRHAVTGLEDAAFMLVIGGRAESEE